MLSDDDEIRGLIQQNRQVFDAAIRASEALLERRSLHGAIALAEAAAHFAASNHCGFFTSPGLERVLQAIGKSLPTSVPDVRACATNRTVLHVLTEAHALGGLTRAVRRWIALDSDSSHVVAVTNQRGQEVPSDIVRATEDSGGSFHVLDQQSSSTLDRATVLRELAQRVHFAILHTHSRDVLPTIAFSSLPALPIAKVDHADHIFWLDVSVTNRFLFMREAAFQMALARRGIGPERGSLVPIPIADVRRSTARESARADLGLPGDAIVLLTIASAYKYEERGGTPLLDAVDTLLRKTPNIYFVAVGPLCSGRWAELSDNFGARFQALGPRGDTERYYSAADIYMDSSPFASNTSLLEAGYHGVPLVSLSPYTDEARVLGPGCPGIDDHICIAPNSEQLVDSVMALVGSEKARTDIGGALHNSIAARHTGSGWRAALESAYAALLVSPRGQACSDFASTSFVDVAVTRILMHAGSPDMKSCLSAALSSSGFRTRAAVASAFHAETGQLARALLLPSRVERTIDRARRSSIGRTLLGFR